MSIAPSPSWVAIPENAGAATVLDFLTTRFPGIERSVWRRRLAEGKVLDESGRPLSADSPCRPRTRLRYFREVESEPIVPFRERVLYRDQHLLVADKPHFLPVVPAGRYVNECLLYRLRRATGEPELTPVHRLDRATAGLVLCSLRRETRAAYVSLFAERRIDKEYLAVVRMPSAPTEADPLRWTVENRLVQGRPPFRIRQAPGPPNARTRFERLSWNAGLALIRAWPETGRKHQIRHHLAACGLPVLHDRTYPELLPEQPPDFERPLQLLARRLAFDDPLTGAAHEFVSTHGLAAESRGLPA